MIVLVSHAASLVRSSLKESTDCCAPRLTDHYVETPYLRGYPSDWVRTGGTWKVSEERLILMAGVNASQPAEEIATQKAQQTNTN